MMCPLCQMPITKEDRKFMVASDKPYFNVFVHRSCLDNYKENLKDQLKTHLSEIMTNYRKKSVK